MLQNLSSAAVVIGALRVIIDTAVDIYAIYAGNYAHFLPSAVVIFQVCFFSSKISIQK